jgi:hypothetical protein
MKVEYPINDCQYQEYILHKVTKEKEGWELNLDGSLIFWCPEDSPIMPRKEMLARLYGGGFGGITRGLFLNGQKVFYRTEAEQKEKNRKDSELAQSEKRNKFEENKVSYFTRISKLPSVFQERIAKFQNTNPDYDWKFGGYELFCCEQAVKLADYFKNDNDLLTWNKLEYKEQEKQCPVLDKGHSGNTFEVSVRLAHWYLSSPENVIVEHGALTPLVGCKEYGCPHDK